MADVTYNLCRTYLKRTETPNTYVGIAKVLLLLALASAIAAWILANGWFLLTLFILCIVSAGIFVHEDYVKHYETKETIYSVPTVYEYYLKNPIYAKAYKEMKATIESDSFAEKHWQDMFNKMNAEIREFDDKIKKAKIEAAIPNIDYAEQIKKSHQLYLGTINDNT